MITVGDFQKELKKENIKLIAGEQGLDKVIEYLDVQEFPFKSTRVHKNTVILTTFYGFRNSDEIIEHFEWYAKIGISAICVHKVVFSEVPNELLELVNQEEIPLFYIPENIAYHLLYEKFNHLLYKERSKLKNEIEQLNQSMLDSLVIEKDIHFIIQSIGKYLGEFIIYIDKEMEVVSFSRSGHFSHSFLKQCIYEIKQVYHHVFNEVRFTLIPKTVSEAKTQLGDFQIFPLNSKVDFYGFLVIGQRNEEVPFRNIVIKNALTALVLDAMKKNQTKEYHKNKDIKLFEEIFSDKRISEITTEEFHFEIERINYLLVVEPKDKSMLREYYSFISAKIGGFSNGLVWIVDNRILALITNEPSDDKEISSKDIRIGISGRLKGLSKADFKTIHEQAIIALRYSYIQDKDYCSWDELGYEKIVYFMSRTNLLKDYHLDYLKSLIHYDKKYGTHFTKTLYIYLQSFFSLKESGKKLHIHPNTVKYRIRKIEEILGRKVDDPDQYMNIMLALIYYFNSEVELI